MSITINGTNLSIEQVIAAARHYEPVIIALESYEKMTISRNIIDKILSQGQVAYGINTGFGDLSNICISENELDKLQYNLVVSCCTGVGDPFPEEVVRAMTLLRINALITGNSGVRPVVVNTLLEMLNKRVHPLVPQKGSVGASGDLAPLSHLALVALGRGEAYYQGKLLPGQEALKLAGIAPLELKAKEGLSLCNGTQAISALGTLAVYDALRLIDTADIIAALSAEALQATTGAFDERIHLVRPHPGQLKTAANLRKLLQDSEILANKSHHKVHDAYSLRCIPQVHGASRDTINYVATVVNREINSVTDNPLVFTDTNEIISGGNFHGQPVALVMDFLGIALAELANISERRIERLTNANLSNGLPPFIIENSGLNDGFMVAQYTAASLVSENKVLAHPASVDSIPTSANQEDHVSMGTISARKCREILQNVQYVLAIEAICACQGIDFRKNQPSPRLNSIYKLIRDKVEYLAEDRELYLDFKTVTEMIKRGDFLTALE